jgi:hypothetical protein
VVPEKNAFSILVVTSSCCALRTCTIFTSDIIYSVRFRNFRNSKKLRIFFIPPRKYAILGVREKLWPSPKTSFCPFRHIIASCSTHQEGSRREASRDRKQYIGELGVGLVAGSVVHLGWPEFESCEDRISVISPEWVSFI